MKEGKKDGKRVIECECKGKGIIKFHLSQCIEAHIEWWFEYEIFFFTYVFFCVIECDWEVIEISLAQCLEKNV